MTNPPPVVYLFHGEDEISIAQSLAELEARLGDPSTASMNTTRLDGRTANLEDIRLAANAMPFLAPRRLVIVDHPLAKAVSQTFREKFEAFLNQLPPTTGLVLIEYKTLKKENWLVAWSEAAGKRAFVRSFSLQNEKDMVKWIQEQARHAGGKFTPPAAALLASLVGADSRTAYQEIQKLLAYTNSQRPVEPEDVDLLTAAERKLEDFALPNALREMDGRKGLNVLHRLLEEDDPLSILGSTIYQIRVLLLARTVLDQGGGVDEIVQELTRYPNLKIKPYPARLAAEAARRMDMADLELIYRRLLEIDAAIKSSEIEGDLALDLFVAGFTARSY
jgi:DNA polymerase-3 subunit delta